MQEEAKRQKRRTSRLEAERTKLLHAHYAGAVPLDLLKKEQARIGREILDATAAIDRSEVDHEQIKDGLDRALNLLTDCERLYPKAPPPLKRVLNQVFFERLEVFEEDRTPGVTVEAAEPFSRILTAHEEYQAWLAAQGSAPRARQAERTQTRAPRVLSYANGLSRNTLVGATGFEPVTPSVSS